MSQGKTILRLKKSDGTTEDYVPIVLLIHTRNPDGSPALMKHITEDQTVDLAGGEQFMIAYAPDKMIHRVEPPPPLATHDGSPQVPEDGS